MKKINILTNLVAVSMLLLSTILITIISVSTVYAANMYYNGDKYITNVFIMNSNNQEISNGGLLTVTDKYDLHYDWEIPDDAFKQGDILYFSIPEEFQIVEVFISL